MSWIKERIAIEYPRCEHYTKAARLQGKCYFEVQVCTVHKRTNIEQTQFVYIINKHLYRRKRIPTRQDTMHLSENIRFDLNCETFAKSSCLSPPSSSSWSANIRANDQQKIYFCENVSTNHFQYAFSVLHCRFVIRVFFTILRNNLPFVQAIVKWISVEIISNLQFKIEF